MKKFKKIIATLLVVLSFATLLAGCSKKTECDICEEVAKCKSKKIMVKRSGFAMIVRISLMHLAHYLTSF